MSKKLVWLTAIATSASVIVSSQPEVEPESTTKTELVATSVDPLLGEIMLFAGNFAPRGWALCHGQLLPISQNSALFSILGTTYGGDGRTTFALPDLRGRVLVGAGNGPGLTPRVLGRKGVGDAKKLSASGVGQPAVNLDQLVRDLASSDRRVSRRAIDALAKLGEAAVPRLQAAQKKADRLWSNAQAALKKIKSSGVDVELAKPIKRPVPDRTSPQDKPKPPAPATRAETGSYVALNYCIALNGTFPSRN